MRRPVVYILFAVLVALLAAVIGVTFPRLASQRTSGVPEGECEAGTIQLRGETGDRLPATTREWRARHRKRAYIVIDLYCNKLFLRTADSIILEAPCSTGSGGELLDTVTGRRWKFETPPGVFFVTSKLMNPWWRKPDWAFIEEGLPVPKNEMERYDDEMMGGYAIGYGDGYFIHGTIYERLLGAAVTHGCTRLGAKDLKKLYENTRIGTPIYVF